LRVLSEPLWRLKWKCSQKLLYSDNSFKNLLVIIFTSSDENLKRVFLFLNNIYNSNTLSHFNNENYYLIFTNFQGYKYKNSYDNIKSYSEFLKSDCEIIMVIVDSVYVDIFVKSSKTLNTIRKNAFDNGYMNIKVLYKINETFRAFEAIEWW